MAWMPFGAGPRICVGMKLAQLEMKMMLAKVLHTFTLVQCKETKVGYDCDIDCYMYVLVGSIAHIWCCNDSAVGCDY
jgi:hypothetical protein